MAITRTIILCRTISFTFSGVPRFVLVFYINGIQIMNINPCIFQIIGYVPDEIFDGGGYITSHSSQFGSSYFMVNLQSNRTVPMTILRHNKNNEFHKNVRVVNVIGFFFYDCSIAFRP